MSDSNDASTNDLLLRLCNSSEAIANALNKLANEPFIEMEIPPPQSPHCNKVDPLVKLDSVEDNAEGYMTQFLVAGTCGHCNGELYSIPRQVVMLGKRSDAVKAFNEMGERNADV